jgi:hypothetical protein
MVYSMAMDYFGFLYPPGTQAGQVRPGIFTQFPGSPTGISYLLNPPGFNEYDARLYNTNNYLEDVVALETINQINSQVCLPQYTGFTPFVTPVPQIPCPPVPYGQYYQPQTAPNAVSLTPNAPNAAQQNNPQQQAQLQAQQAQLQAQQLQQQLTQQQGAALNRQA